MVHLAVISAKEGVINAIQEKIGSTIIDSVLETSDGTDSKMVDQIDLRVLLNTVLNAAEQPTASDTHNEYKAFIAAHFDFCGKLVNAVEQILNQSK